MWHLRFLEEEEKKAIFEKAHYIESFLNAPSIDLSKGSGIETATESST